MQFGETSKNKISTTKVLVGAILFGTAGTVVTYAPNSATPTGLGLMRLLVGALFLILLLPKFGSSFRSFFKLVKRPLVWVMAFCSAAYQPLFFGATEKNGVAISTLLTVGCIPIFASIVGRTFLKEKITLTWALATALAIIGLTLRSVGEISVENSLGLFMAIGAGATVGFYLNAAKIELRRGTNQVALPAMAYLIGSFMLLPILIGEPLDWLQDFSGIWVSIYLGIVTMAIANAFQISGLRNLSPGPAATLTLADPFTATLLGVLVLNEPLSTIGLVGIALVGIALIWQSRAINKTYPAISL